MCACSGVVLGGGVMSLVVFLLFMKFAFKFFEAVLYLFVCFLRFPF